MPSPQALRPRQKVGTVPYAPETYGRSVLGAPLDVWRPAGDCRVLIFATIHGEETETTFVLSRALRNLAGPSPHCAVVLSMNPDGAARGTRGNANGVDLNRNWPTATWSPEPVCHRYSFDHPRDVELSPGAEPASEPEVRALRSLIEELRPHTVVAMHSNLDCIEDPKGGVLAHWFGERTGLKVVDDVGYATPGSFGTWCGENGYDVITYELPDQSPETLVKTHTPAFLELLQRTDL